jgi:flagellar biosynthesis protein
VGNRWKLWVAVTLSWTTATVAAHAHGVPIRENAALAGALSEVEIGDEIPEQLYKAVAEVLIFILRMSGKIK